MNTHPHGGAYLRAARKARGLTLAQLAAPLGVGVVYLSQLERGVRSFDHVLRWTRERLEALGDALQFDLDTMDALIRQAAEHRLDGLLSPDEFTVEV